MALIKSIAGIRGTIGGAPGDNLTPLDIVKFTSAYASFITRHNSSHPRPPKGCDASLRANSTGGAERRVRVVVGRDARISGEMVQNIVTGTLMACGVDVVDAGLCSTPGVEMAVVHYGAAGGIVLTASHNPRQWNALKLLDSHGEFLNAAAGAEILAMVESLDYSVPTRSCEQDRQPEAAPRGGLKLTFGLPPSRLGQVEQAHLPLGLASVHPTAGFGLTFASVDELGRVVKSVDFTDTHIEKVLALPLVDAEAVRARKFKIVVDAVNSVGGVVIPRLLERLGCEVVRLNCEPTGEFAHNPEPLPENLGDVARAVVDHKADLGVVVDPDVDRLALVNEDGTMFGEEYTLVAVADYVLGRMGAGCDDAVDGTGRVDGAGDIMSTGGGANIARTRNTVSNLSSTRALKDVTERHGGRYFASAVGEVNVVAEMKRVGAAIGGEGNGGVIYPASHYGRDAVVGVALFLSHLALSGKTMTGLRADYPDYYISKNRVDLAPGTDVDALLERVYTLFSDPSALGAGVQNISTVDGVKIDFAHGWVHLRRSNTEPIIRIYSEAADKHAADDLAQSVIRQLK